MREKLCRQLLKTQERWPSEILRRLQLQILLNRTSAAFDVQREWILQYSWKKALAKYAAFSKRCMESGAADPEKLYRQMYSVGERLRKRTGFTKKEDLQRLLVLLYRNIGITMEGDIPEKIRIPVCFFSRIYMPEECAVMSAMDSGLTAGLFGGGKLVFSERITEGCGNCTACLRKEKDQMKEKKTAIVIGTGAGGAMMAKELQGPYQVTVLEAGGKFRPFPLPVNKMAGLRKTGLFFDERLIRLILPNMVIDKTRDMVLVRGKGLGGTTTLATGNAVRYDGDLKKLGIDLDEEFGELYRELPITTDHQKDWTDTTKKMFTLFEEMGLEPVVTPKLLCAEKCVGCGHCAIGCPTGAKWDTRAWIDEAVENGAALVTGCSVTDLEIQDGKVTGVHARRGWRKARYEADLVILAAGGLGTPVILKNSGIRCEERLFVDPVLCVAGPLPGIRQDHQILMPFISQQDGYILSPYMDYLSFFFDKRWRMPMQGLASIMIKLADEEKGDVDGRKVCKTMTKKDRARMKKAIAQSREILVRLGVPREKQFLGTLNAGHPGGMLPLTEEQRDTLHDPRLPENLYVADAAILPKAMGNPPILTIMALAKKIAREIKENDNA